MRITCLIAMSVILFGCNQSVQEDKTTEQLSSDKLKELLIPEGLYMPKIEITGYVYLEETTEQLKLINQLVRNLKENEIFSEIFQEIRLEDASSKKYQGYAVTFFRIRFV